MKTATVIPIHPPRFGFANQIVETWNKFCTSDLFFILSNPDDETNFKKLIEGNYKTLTLPENLTHYKNPITVKKFYGVQTHY